MKKLYESKNGVVKPVVPKVSMSRPLSLMIAEHAGKRKFDHTIQGRPYIGGKIEGIYTGHFWLGEKPFGNDTLLQNKFEVKFKRGIAFHFIITSMSPDDNEDFQRGKGL